MKIKKAMIVIAAFIAVMLLLEFSKLSFGVGFAYAVGAFIFLLAVFSFVRK